MSPHVCRVLAGSRVGREEWIASRRRESDDRAHEGGLSYNLSDDLAVKVRRRPASCDARQEGKLAEPQPALGHS